MVVVVVVGGVVVGVVTIRGGGAQGRVPTALETGHGQVVLEEGDALVGRQQLLSGWEDYQRLLVDY